MDHRALRELDQPGNSAETTSRSRATTARGFRSLAASGSPRSATIAAFVVSGDSMAPIVADGASVAYAKDEEDVQQLDGKMVVTWLDNQPVVRWFQHCGRYALLRAQNPSTVPQQVLVDLEDTKQRPRFRRVLWVNYTPLTREFAQPISAGSPDPSAMTAYQLRYSSKQGSTRILPSPIRPVRACPTIALIAAGASVRGRRSPAQLWARTTNCIRCPGTGAAGPSAARIPSPRERSRQHFDDSSAASTAWARNGLTRAMIWTTGPRSTGGDESFGWTGATRFLVVHISAPLPLQRFEPSRALPARSLLPCGKTSWACATES